jgi:hypothetical protein
MMEPEKKDAFIFSRTNPITLSSKVSSLLINRGNIGKAGDQLPASLGVAEPPPGIILCSPLFFFFFFGSSSHAPPVLSAVSKMNI